MQPLQEEIVGDVRKEKIEEIVNFLSMLKQIDYKNNEALILRILAQLDQQVSDHDYSSSLSKPAARRLLDLIQNGKQYKNLKPILIQPVAKDN